MQVPSAQENDRADGEVRAWLHELLGFLEYKDATNVAKGIATNRSDRTRTEPGRTWPERRAERSDANRTVAKSLRVRPSSVSVAPGSV